MDQKESIKEKHRRDKYGAMDRNQYTMVGKKRRNDGWLQDVQCLNQCTMEEEEMMVGGKHAQKREKTRHAFNADIPSEYANDGTVSKHDVDNTW